MADEGVSGSVSHVDEKLARRSTTVPVRPAIVGRDVGLETADWMNLTHRFTKFVFAAERRHALTSINLLLEGFVQ